MGKYFAFFVILETSGVGLLAFFTLVVFEAVVAELILWPVRGRVYKQVSKTQQGGARERYRENDKRCCRLNEDEALTVAIKR